MNELEYSCGVKDLSFPTLVLGSPARLCFLLVEVCGLAGFIFTVRSLF